MTGRKHKCWSQPVSVGRGTLRKTEPADVFKWRGHVMPADSLQAPAEALKSDMIQQGSLSSEEPTGQTTSTFFSGHFSLFFKV